MQPLIIWIIALALAVDAFAVALAAGAMLPQITYRQTFRLCWHFGLFQAGMTVIGWGAGLSFRTAIEKFDHWVAFGLLIIVGGNMIYEALKTAGDREFKDPTRGKTMILLSVATSIDALAVGLSFSMLNIHIWQPALIIGFVATILTCAGLYLGRWAGSKSHIGERAEIIGGLVLIGIGLKILHDHLQ